MCVSANVEIILPRLAPPVKPFFVPFPLESGAFPLLTLPWGIPPSGRNPLPTTGSFSSRFSSFQWCLTLDFLSKFQFHQNRHSFYTKFHKIFFVFPFQIFAFLWIIFALFSVQSNLPLLLPLFLLNWRIWFSTERRRFLETELPTRAGENPQGSTDRGQTPITAAA